MYYYNYFRFADPNEFNSLNDISENEITAAPSCCPYYRQFFPPQQLPPFGQGGQQSSGPPPGPPPFAEPSQSFSATMAVEPGTLRPCLFTYVYIWPRRQRPFWAWLDFVGRRSVSGFRWERHRWIRFGMDLRQIDSFVCR